MNSRLIPVTGRRRFAVAILGALVALAASTMGAAQATATTVTHTRFFVDCSRAAQGNGTEGTPWNSLGAVNRHAAFVAGDAILLKRGVSCAGRLHPSGSGTTTAPIVLGAYGTGRALPTINGGGTPRDTGAITLLNQSHWTVQDLHVTNHNAAKETNVYRAGVLLSNIAGGRLSGVTVQRLKIDGVVSNLTYKQLADPREFGGIAVVTWPGARPNSGFDTLRITHNTIAKVGRTGIVVSNHGYPSTSDRNVRISYNGVTRARGDSIVLRGSTNARIDHNVSAYGADFWPCKQCGAITPQTANAGIWPAASRNTVIEYNEVYGEHRLGGDGQGFDVDMDAVNTVLQYNYAHDNQAGGILFCGSGNATARFNILENNSSGEFVFIGSIPATNTSIYNNTVYTSVQNGAHVVHLQGVKGGKGIKFYNNLIYNMGWGYYQWPAAVTTRNNSVIGTHGLGEPRDPWTVFDTPILRNPGQGGIGFNTLGGYHPSSPKDDGPGIAIPKSVTKDFFGNTISPKRPPRGAALK